MPLIKLLVSLEDYLFLLKIARGFATTITTAAYRDNYKRNEVISRETK